MPVIRRHQTLLDFSVQWSGSVEGLITLALSTGTSPTDDAVPGAQLPVIPILDAKVAGSFASSGNEIATANKQVAGPPQPEGIGYWIIAQDFKVS